MTKDELVIRYPTLYHMAEAGSWPSIQRHGLLSTTALLDLFGISGSGRYKIESQWRPTRKTVYHPDYGKAAIRDQRPMPDSELWKCLVGLTPQEWYEFLNRKTFFWVTTDRLIRMLNAWAYQNRAHWVITVDTKALLDRHAEQAALSHFNTGFAYDNRKRGRDTFKTIKDYHTSWVAELAVEYSVPDIGELTICVEEWKRNKRLRVIWKP